MKIFNAEQLRAWDDYTIKNEPIDSIDLMERAAACCLDWIDQQGFLERSFTIFCSKGNNGGDGLALARMLSVRDCIVSVCILEFGYKGTLDFQQNLARLHGTPVEIRFIQSAENFHPVPPDNIIIDALFGSGLNRPVEGVTKQLIEFINHTGNDIIAIDIPSGLYVDRSSDGNTVVQATHTLTFQTWKRAFLVPENGYCIGELHLLDIGLHPAYLLETPSLYSLLDARMAASIYRPRKKFAHKGNFGHALLIAGGYGKMGAAVMASRACLRTGAGLLSCHIPASGNTILQTTVPEAMLLTDRDEKILTTLEEDLTRYNAIGVGPGIGVGEATKLLLGKLLSQYQQPLVLDADALNIIGANPGFLDRLPPHSILTPHPKEFERLFGPSDNDFDRMDLALQKAGRYQCIIILKGHNTLVALPSDKGYFNTTGNAGMAKGGSGDVLTGMLTALLAQGYEPAEAAVLGVWLHGLAGDLAAATLSQEAMLAGDLIEHIGQAFLYLQKM